MELTQGGSVLHVHCQAPVLSLTRIAGSRHFAEGMAGSESLLAGCKGGQLAVIVVSRSQGVGCLSAQLRQTAQLPPHAGKEVAAETDLYVTSAHKGEGDDVMVLAHHVVGKHHVEVVALRLEGAACGQLATLHSSCPPRGSCWFGPRCAMLIANAGFETSQPEPMDCTSMAEAELEYRGSDVVVTAFWLGAEEPEVVRWRLSQGELLGAWPEEGNPGGPEAAAEAAAAGPSSLAAAVADGHGAVVLRLALPPAPGSQPIVASSVFVPGLGACSSARPNLSLVLASPSRTFFALVEGRGRNAVSLFRSPSGAARAPTAAPDLEDGGGGEVFGVFLGDSAVVVLQRGRVVRCPLEASARVLGASRPLALQQDLPMGIDPKALLRMLDAQGDD